MCAFFKKRTPFSKKEKKKQKLFASVRIFYPTKKKTYKFVQKEKRTFYKRRTMAIFQKAPFTQGRLNNKPLMNVIEAKSVLFSYISFKKEKGLDKPFVL